MNVLPHSRWSRRTWSQRVAKVLTWLGGCLTLAAQAQDSLTGRHAAGVLLARMADPDMDPQGFLVSEKLDGVRAIWDGRVLRSRSGQRLHPPEAFLASLPRDVVLDGELWLGRGRFEAMAALVQRRRPEVGAWQEVQYCLFELPQAGGMFSQRAEQIRQLVAQQSDPSTPLRAVEQFVVPDPAALQVRLQEVIQAGGEGLVLHRADAPNLSGRSGVLLKLKPVHEDEAMVIGHTPGQGQFQGQMGALQVRNAEGVVFLIGSGFTAEQRQQPPAVGSLIVYRCRGQTAHGLPRFASFVRVRA